MAFPSSQAFPSGAVKTNPIVGTKADFNEPVWQNVAGQSAMGFRCEQDLHEFGFHPVNLTTNVMSMWVGSLVFGWTHYGVP